MTAARTPPGSRSAYRSFRVIPTRWMDNDAYGHVNNVVYYAFFDTAVNQHLIETGCLDVASSPVVGLVVETQCRFHSSIAFPDAVTAGIRVAHLGRSSVRYEIGLFRGEADLASAEGHFVHVYVARGSQTVVPLPSRLRDVLSALTVE